MVSRCTFSFFCTVVVDDDDDVFSFLAAVVAVEVLFCCSSCVGFGICVFKGDFSPSNLELPGCTPLPLCQGGPQFLLLDFC